MYKHKHIPSALSREWLLPLSVLKTSFRCSSSACITRHVSRTTAQNMLFWCKAKCFVEPATWWFVDERFFISPQRSIHTLIKELHWLESSRTWARCDPDAARIPLWTPLLSDICYQVETSLCYAWAAQHSHTLPWERTEREKGGIERVDRWVCEKLQVRAPEYVFNWKKKKGTISWIG